LTAQHRNLVVARLTQLPPSGTPCAAPLVRKGVSALTFTQGALPTMRVA